MFTTMIWIFAKVLAYFGQLVRNHCFLVFFFYSTIVPVQQNIWLFLTQVEMVFLGTPYFLAVSFLRDFFLGISKPAISRLNFFLSFRLTEDMLLPERCWKKKEQTSQQSFVDAIISIRIPEINSMIHWKTSFECSR